MPSIASVDFRTFGNVFHHPNTEARIKGALIYIGQEIAQSQLPPQSPPADLLALARKKALVAHFNRAPEHWLGVIRNRLAVSAQVAPVQSLLPIEELTDQQRTDLQTALYQAILALVEEYKDQVTAV